MKSMKPMNGSLSFIKETGKELEDNINTMGGGLFVDAAKGLGKLVSKGIKPKTRKSRAKETAPNSCKEKK